MGLFIYSIRMLSQNVTIFDPLAQFEVINLISIGYFSITNVVLFLFFIYFIMSFILSLSRYSYLSNPLSTVLLQIVNIINSALNDNTNLKRKQYFFTFFYLFLFIFLCNFVGLVPFS
jgi:F0F1-type ATP synthase membrane subunit a